jgi:hypothetical protein
MKCVTITAVLKSHTENPEATQRDERLWSSVRLWCGRVVVRRYLLLLRLIAIDGWQWQER